MGYLAEFEIWECRSVLILYTSRILAPVFGWEIEGIWTRVLHRSCSCICELDVRLLNHPNWTSTAHVMVHFPGLPQLRPFLSLCPDFGTGFRDWFETVPWLVLWLNYGLFEAGIVACM